MALQKISARKIEFLTLTICSLREQRGQASVPRSAPITHADDVLSLKVFARVRASPWNVLNDFW